MVFVAELQDVMENFRAMASATPRVEWFLWRSYRMLWKIFGQSLPLPRGLNDFCGGVIGCYGKFSGKSFRYPED